MIAATEGKVTARSVTDYLDARLPREPGTKIQYGHPSPRFWVSRRDPVEELLAPLTPDRALTLYLHIPFCPPTDPEACGFCLFAREDFVSYQIVESYLRDLVAELERQAEVTGRRRLRAVYFGGGTPNILKAEQIGRLFARVHELFEIPPEAEITFEGTPALFTMDRLEMLADSGCNRISIGVQSLDPHLIAYTGRRQRPEQVRRTIAFCADNDIRCSVDLITGWFEQTAQHLINDIDALTDWGVTEIVNHALTLAGDSEFARRREELPTVEVTCRSFLAAREHLLKRGYRADSYSDYRRSDLPAVEYLEIYRDVLNNDRIGVGCGANSLMAGTLDRPGHTFKNVSGVGAYHQAVEEGGSCAESLHSYTAEDLRLLYVLKGLEGTPYLNAAAYEEIFGSDLREDFAPWWKALSARGWLVWDGGSPLLVNEGVFYTATIQRSLSEPRNAELRRELERRESAAAESRRQIAAG